ncbi:NACHT domain-containing protein [Marinobacter salarius]|uniref:NACHT domain-containing protein n=1 Tax=Marinobacter salarius TaxID=1420917 RepID=UPI001D18F6BC|nr:NACHT domain-containing protein [Marinobacter salarius]MCC4284363.1 NACHT domain-containing protein [Marinobacter salarius]
MDFGTTAAITSAAKPILDDILSFTQIRIKDRKIKKINKESEKNIVKNLASVENVKTIWQYEKEVNLNNFYYPSRVTAPGLKISIQPKIVSEISENQSIVIQGIAGQGKSILLRYLAANEIRSGLRIPVFSELRRIKQNQTVKSLIASTMQDLGFFTDEDLIKSYLDSGKVLILFDGFDELPSDETGRVVDEIESLIKRHDKLQIVVTSRPDSGIQASSLFRVTNIDNLKYEDHLPFLKKICSANSEAERIVEAINSSTIEIKSLLSTPLLLTLLAIVFKAEQAIPSQFSDFYEKLFHILFTRHDSSKPGFKREKKSKLSEDQLEEIFSSFSFLTRQAQQTSLSYSEAISFARKCSEVTEIDFVPSAFIDDMTKVTCLMIEEGLQLFFIHKSVQEFFSAKFIKNLPEKTSKSVYEKIQRKFGSWVQEAKFLISIDTYRSLKYLFIPLSKQFLEKYNSQDEVEAYLNSCKVTLERAPVDEQEEPEIKLVSVEWPSPGIITKFYDAYHSLVMEKMMSSMTLEGPFNETQYLELLQIRKTQTGIDDKTFSSYDDGSEEIEGPLLSFMEILGIEAKAYSLFGTLTRKVKNDLEKYERELARQDHLESIIDI